MWLAYRFSRKTNNTVHMQTSLCEHLFCFDIFGIFQKSIILSDFLKKSEWETRKSEWVSVYLSGMKLNWFSTYITFWWLLFLWVFCREILEMWYAILKKSVGIMRKWRDWNFSLLKLWKRHRSCLRLFRGKPRRIWEGHCDIAKDIADFLRGAFHMFSEIL